MEIKILVESDWVDKSPSEWQEKITIKMTGEHVLEMKYEVLEQIAKTCMVMMKEKAISGNFVIEHIPPFSREGAGGND